MIPISTIDLWQDTSPDNVLEIWRFLHFTDNSVVQLGANSGATSSPTGNSAPSSSTDNGAPSSSPPECLWKVHPVISAVLAACRTHYRPHWEQSIDEAMVAFKGRSSMKQYLPNKVFFPMDRLAPRYSVCMDMEAWKWQRERKVIVYSSTHSLH